YAAQMYCKWLTATTGRYYRLPTEIEWEYACRCGTETAFEFGDDESELDDYAWYLGNSPDGYNKVMTKKPNSWGLYDMHGNVCEWVMDQYDKKAYKDFASGKIETPFVTPKKPLSVYAMFNEVSRGGSCAHEAADCRSAKRIVSDKSWKEHDPQFPQSIWWMTEAPYVGFRVVRPLAVPSAEEAKLFEPDPAVWAKYKELNPR
ncbi:MAG: formylglycine-generating enzyme family protein, partial [Thermoguttaceae bacterium]|nr:formylglycine-generating enzyme family protein [Thermoguttaceae bacterium]